MFVYCLFSIYFSDRLYSEDELPAEFKLFLPVQKAAGASAALAGAPGIHTLSWVCHTHTHS